METVVFNPPLVVHRTASSLLHLSKKVVESARMKICFFVRTFVTKTLSDLFFEIFTQPICIVCALYILDTIAH